MNVFIEKTKIFCMLCMHIENFVLFIKVQNAETLIIRSFLCAFVYNCTCEIALVASATGNLRREARKKKLGM